MLSFSCKVFKYAFILLINAENSTAVLVCTTIVELINVCIWHLTMAKCESKNEPLNSQTIIRYY